MTAVFGLRQSVEAGCVKSERALDECSALAQIPVPGPVSRRGLREKSEPAALQGHHPPAASALSSVPARVPPQAAPGRESKALVAAPPPLSAGVLLRSGAAAPWLRLHAGRPLMVHSVYLCLDSN